MKKKFRQLAFWIGFQNKREVFYFSLICLFVIICTNLPHLIAWLQTPKGAYYLGYGGYTYQGDITAYLMRINQGIRGAWLFEEWYTPEKVAPTFLYGIYLALGHLARFFRLDARVALHFGRALLLPILFLSLYGFATRFIGRQKSIRYFSALVFPLGLSWIFLPLGATTGDQLLEMNIFGTAKHVPHFILGTILAIWLYALYLQIHTFYSHRKLFLFSILILLEGFTYPFALVPLLGTLFFFPFLLWLKNDNRIDTRKEIRILSASLAAALLPLGYYAYLFYTDIFFANWWWDQQSYGKLYPIYLITGFGLFAILAFAAFYRCLISKKKVEQTFLLLCSWFSLTFFFSYLPYPSSRRGLLGLQIPLVLLAARELAQIKPRIHSLFLTIVYAVAALNAVYLMFYGIFWSNGKSKFTYLAANQYDAMRWLGDHEPEPVVTLSTLMPGFYMPAVASQKTVLGQNSETYNALQKTYEVYHFYAADAPLDYHKKLIERYHIAYIYFGPDEQAISNFDLDKLSFIKKVYDQAGVRIYKTNRE